jgi:tetratricopeptide (TPR) repeat protein
MAAPNAKDALARARTAYNQGLWNAALSAAEEAQKVPEYADRAALVSARAYLERFRANDVADDLDRAREQLRRLNPSKFSRGEHLEFLVGLGEALYLDGQTGTAAALFESVIVPETELSGNAREQVLNWWASALDTDARLRPEIDRRGIYQRVRDRMMEELVTNPGSATASYWLAAAARGQGDLQTAWDAAHAAWVRASLAPDGGRELRSDLDELVQRAIVPERSRILGQPVEVLAAEWDLFKQNWRR